MSHAFSIFTPADRAPTARAATLVNLLPGQNLLLVLVLISLILVLNGTGSGYV